MVEGEGEEDEVEGECEGIKDTPVWLDGSLSKPGRVMHGVQLHRSVFINPSQKDFDFQAAGQVYDHGHNSLLFCCFAAYVVLEALFLYCVIFPLTICFFQTTRQVQKQI